MAQKGRGSRDYAEQGASWISGGEKFALIALDVSTEGHLVSGPVSEGLEVITSEQLHLSDHLKEWLGSTRVEEIERCNLILVSRARSRNPGVLDGENRLLTERVGRWYTGLMVESLFAPAQEPFSATGAMENTEIDVRQAGNLECPRNGIVRRYPEVTTQNLLDAAHIASVIEGLVTSSRGPRLWRLFRCLSIYQRARATSDLMDRIHQYARCVEGFLVPKPGDTKKQFKSRTELFVGPRHHEMMGTIYDIRSEVEHLHEDRRLEPFDRDKRLELVRLEAVIEELARRVLHRLLHDAPMAEQFGNRDSLELFWSLAPAERQEIWGPTFDPLEPLRDFKGENIQNRELGYK